MSNAVSISVIVAVFQAEPYLRRCVDSIISQSYADIEILLIDDGSTDGSGEICDKYATKDSRIKVFHKINEGRSATRQFGLDNCQGEYTIYFDADDWVEPNMLELLYFKAISNSADIVMCDVILEDGEGRCRYVKQGIEKMETNHLLDAIYDPLFASLWNKLIRRDCYKKYSVRYAPEMEYAEDLYVMLQLLKHPIKVEYIPYGLYHYDRVSNTNSITRNLCLEDIIKSIEYMQVHLDESADKALSKLKRDALQIAYSKGRLHKPPICDLYHEIDGDLILTGILHPIKRWKCLVIGLDRKHILSSENIYAFFVKMANKFQKIICS